MKIAMFGGSFNPVHLGHLALADSVCTSLGYDKVLFVPLFCAPHKESSFGISNDKRLKLLELAIKDDERFALEKCEIEREGTSYTFDTVTFLEKKYESVLEGKIGVILGSDLVEDFHHWYRAEELAEKCDLILARRPLKETFQGEKSFSSKAIGNFFHEKKEDFKIKEIDQLEKNFSFPHKSVSNMELTISSSAIRMACKNNLPWRYLVTKEVFDYIKENNLYK